MRDAGPDLLPEVQSRQQEARGSNSCGATMPNRIGTGFRQGAGLHASLSSAVTPRQGPVLQR
jgi:hypothetical protein